MRENDALQERFLAFQERNEENMKMVQNLSDRAAQQQKALRQQMKDQADQDKEDLIKALNEKHDEE